MGVRRRAATAPAPFSESPKREAEKKRPYNFLERSLAAAKIESFRLRDFPFKKKKKPRAEKWAGLGLVWAGRQRQRKSAAVFTPFAPSLRDVAVSLGCAQLVRRVVMTEHDIDILVPVGV